MKSNSKIGVCRLCGQRTTLVESHIWPRFAYKRYVSNTRKGGQFINLQTGDTRANKHYTQPWLCLECDRDRLGANEAYVAELCAKVDENQDGPWRYDAPLLKFATSISWRTALADAERSATDDVFFKRACKHWKDYLRDKKRRVRPYSQHLFVVFPQDVPLHHGLGGEVFLDDHLVLSQIGPLFIVGLCDRKHLSNDDLDIWERSELQEDGGTLSPVQEWCIGKTITKEFARLLRQHESRIKSSLLGLVE